MCRPLNLWFFCNCTATTELYTLSLHDALPISLPTTVERVAAGQFTREAIAVVKNRQFIEFCDRVEDPRTASLDRKSTRLNSSHANISYAVFCLKKKRQKTEEETPSQHTTEPSS